MRGPPSPHDAPRAVPAAPAAGPRRAASGLGERPAGSDGGGGGGGGGGGPSVAATRPWIRLWVMRCGGGGGGEQRAQAAAHAGFHLRISSCRRHFYRRRRLGGVGETTRRRAVHAATAGSAVFRSAACGTGERLLRKSRAALAAPAFSAKLGNRQTAGFPRCIICGGGRGGQRMCGFRVMAARRGLRGRDGSFVEVAGVICKISQITAQDRRHSVMTEKSIGIKQQIP